MQSAKHLVSAALPCRARAARIGVLERTEVGMADLTLYIGNKNYSSWSLRPWLALKQAGAAFEEVLIPLDLPDTPDLLRRHSPSRRVSVLQHGGLVLWESMAISEHAPELFPAARLWPEDREPRGRPGCRQRDARRIRQHAPPYDYGHPQPPAPRRPAGGAIGRRTGDADPARLPRAL